MTLHNHWIVFEELVIPSNADNVQRSEMKKAFYAGFAQMYEVTMSLGSKHVTESDLHDMMSGLSGEIGDFAREQIKK